MPTGDKVSEGAKIRISKTLSQILRHKAVDLNIPIRNDGYARVVDVLRCPWMTKLHVTLELLQEIVAGNDKKRFTLNQEDGEWHIRANQGHSIPIDDVALLTKLDAATLPADLECIHGTFFKHWESIQKKGLLAGGTQGAGFRTHIHFAPRAEKVISGMRYNCDVIISIDLKLALEDGVDFYQSSNGVILTRGLMPHHNLPPKYFRRVVRIHGKSEIVLFE